MFSCKYHYLCKKSDIMRKSILTILASLLSLSSMVAQPLPTSLIPSEPSKAPDYFCTWNIQGFCVSYEGDTRNMMTEQNIFGKGEWQDWASFFPRIREDVLFLLDDSWDMPLQYRPVIDQYYGLVSLDTERFPSFQGYEVKRIADLAARIKSYGWKGLAGWVCAQESPLDPYHEQEREYWRRQMAVAHAAGMDYLKVDYGRRQTDVNWRKMLTEVAHEISPDLYIEHASPKGPTVTDTPELDASLARVSDVFRTYDVETFMAIPVTLKRVLQVLGQRPEDGCQGLVNCEDEPYMAAGLGCLIGIMRHPYAGSLPNGKSDHVFPATCRDVKHRLDEVVRAVRWHRLAEPFGMDDDLHVDSVMLHDSWLLGERETWYDPHKPGTTCREEAPARVSRRMPLPTVQAKGAVPYVLASRYPSGAVAVAALERLDGRRWFQPRAKVGIQATDVEAPLGVFGYYDQLTISYPDPIDKSGLHVMAQDLAGNEAVDITREVTIHGHRLVIPGRTIQRIGLQASTPGDKSAPGLVVKMLLQ